MDPFTISRLGQIRQQEILKFAEENRHRKSIREITRQLGNLLVVIGQKMTTAANHSHEEQTIAPNTNVESCT